MNKVDLSKYSIGLCLISDIKMEDSFNSFQQCVNYCKFSEYNFFSSKNISNTYEEKINCIKTKPINSQEDYSKFVLFELNKYIHTSYILVCQHDGFIVNSLAWNEKWLNYDYIGAPCYWSGKLSMGNGGFSLRSKKLLNVIDEKKDIFDKKRLRLEDVIIGRDYRKVFEKEGIVYAPLEEAKEFAWEKYLGMSETYDNQFGIHFGGSIPQEIYRPYIKESSRKHNFIIK